jgi:hypothetical protein
VLVMPTGRAARGSARPMSNAPSVPVQHPGRDQHQRAHGHPDPSGDIVGKGVTDDHEGRVGVPVSR